MAGIEIGIAEYLKDYHTAEATAIKARELCELFNLKDRQLRIIVNALRHEGIAVCSSTYGYWYSTNPDDVEKTLRRLEEQVKNMNTAITGLKRVLQEGTNEE